MHEVSIMAEAVQLAAGAARSAGAARVLKLRLRVGALSGVVPEALQFAFEIVSRDTVVAGAALEVEPVPAARWCPVCDEEFECADLAAECPRCRHPGGEWRRGRELEIAAVEVN